MANTTNFGWQTPDDTSLVKDGAAAMRTLGNSIDTSLVDLKGGTTGQILSKASNTDLDYTWINNDQGDITGVTAGTGLTGGGTSGAVTLDFDVANYGGGQWAAGKNKIINGNFGIWQRGTSFTATGYSADRWYFIRSNTTTLSQQSFTVGSAPVTGYEGTFFCRLARTAGSGDDYLIQRIEDVRTFANQTATISFWAKADTATTISEVYFEQNFGSGGSTSVGAGNTAIAITTSWARYTLSVSIPSISGKTIGTGSFLGLTFKLGSAMGNRTVDIWGVQVEAGSVATPFQTATGTIQGELAACQRYYWRSQNTATGAFVTPTGFAQSTTQLRVSLPFKQTMRISPTATIEYGNLQVIDGASGYAITSIAYGNTGSLEFADLIFTTSGLTQFRPGIINTTATGGYLGLSAEL